MRFMSGGLNEEGEDQTGENKMQEVFFFFPSQDQWQKMLNGGTGRGAQFLWQQASWETAVNQSTKEISRS